jgi:hypothetical protein
MEQYSNQNLTDRQFLKIRTNGYVVYFALVELTDRGRPRRTFRRETRIDVLERMLSAPLWIADVISAHVSTVLHDGLRKWSQQDDHMKNQPKQFAETALGAFCAKYEISLSKLSRMCNYASRTTMHRLSS